MRKVKIWAVFFFILIIMASGCSKSLDEKTREHTYLSKMPEEYSGLLEEYYQYILHFDHNEESNDDFDYSKSAIWEMLLIMQPEEILKEVGYAVKDMNEDNVPELVIGDVNDEAGSMEMGGIYAIFTLKEDLPQLILAGNPRDKYFYLGDGEFVNQNANGWDYYLSLFKLNKGETVLEPKGMYVSQIQESSDVQEKYYYSESNDYDLERAKELTEEEFDKVLETTTGRVVKIEYIPFSKYTKEQSSLNVENTQKSEGDQGTGQVSEYQNKKSQKSLEEDPLAFQNTNDLKQCLVGEWIYQDPVSMKNSAWITVLEDGSYHFKILHPEHGGEYKSEGEIEILDFLKDESGVGNVISFKRASFKLPKEEEEMYLSDEFDGDYALNYKTLGEGEVIIELFQVNNGTTLMFNTFGSPVHVFRKESEWKQNSNIKKNTEFYAICSKKDYRNGIIWLDEVDYDKETCRTIYKQPFEAIAYISLELEPKNLSADVEYLCELLYVVTDADGKVISCQEVERADSPF